MRRKRFPWLLIVIFLFLTAVLGIAAFWIFKENILISPEVSITEQEGSVETPSVSDTVEEIIGDAIDTISRGYEPKEVRELREQELVLTDEGHQEYYFQQLSETEKRLYREMLNGIRKREKEFYLTSSDDQLIDRAYQALLCDHPELFWVHNRQQVFKTTYSNSDYCLFAPGYIYTDAEVQEIQLCMEQAYQAVSSMITDDAGTYDKIKTVYTYIIDHADYIASEHDQSIAGIFWKGNAVCAGYAGAVQYLLERLGVTCIYVTGEAKENTEGHAWNIVEINGQYYYVDATNGDQTDFLEGDAVKFEEHKTIIYDYLCPFPDEYELSYTAHTDFVIPDCTASDQNFYVLNQGCFDFYDWQSLYDYCCMRLNNGAAVVRFKFSNQEAFDQAYQEWIVGGEIQSAARYYLDLYGYSEIQYHYGILDNLKTMYFMF